LGSTKGRISRQRIGLKKKKEGGDSQGNREARPCGRSGKEKLFQEGKKNPKKNASYTPARVR